MSKNRRGNKKNPKLLLWVIIAVAVIAALFIFPEESLLVLDFLLEEETPTTQVTQPAEVEHVSGDTGIFQVYFTNPEIPFSGQVSEGIEIYLIELIDSADESVYLAAFEFDLPNLADALIRAHDRGIDVQVVYDEEHTMDDLEIDEIIDAGITTRAYTRSSLMHNKFVIIDGEVVWTGSFNFTINASNRNNENALVITSTRIAQNYLAEFEEMMANEFGASSPENTIYPVVEVNGIAIETYFAPEDDVMERLVEVVSTAETEVHFMAFSYTHDDLGMAMQNLMANGVSVAGVFETRGAGADYSECTTLLFAGADVRLDGNPRTMHHKVIVIDDSIVITGSYNFSANADESNDENLLIIYDPDLAALYEAEFESVMSQALIPSGDICSKD